MNSLSPIDSFKKDWQSAKAANESAAHYCTLATVDNHFFEKKGQPSIRTLVLREVTEDSFIVFINNSSPKWQELEHSDQWELMTFWPDAMQQYRVRGELTQVSSEQMQQHWHNKPYDSKILDYYYNSCQSQSSVIGSREHLLQEIKQLKKKYPSDADIPVQGNAIGINLKATYIEQWYAVLSDRLHERYLYQLTDTGEWHKRTLVP